MTTTATLGPQRIVRLTARNFKGIRAIEIDANGKSLELRGKNGAGKSTVIDLIWAMLGGKGASPKEPITVGEEKAEAELTLDGLVIRRTWTRKDTYLHVFNRDGSMPAGGGQTLLDRLIGKMGFDPSAWLRMAPKDQADALRVAVGLDFTELEGKIRGAYTRRTDYNREVKRLETLTASEPPKAERVDTGALMHKRREFDAHRVSREESIRQLGLSRRVVDDIAQRRERMTAELARLEADHERAVTDVGEREAELEQLEDPTADLASIDEQLGAAAELNQRAAAREAWEAHTAELSSVRKSADECTAKIAEAEAEKKELLAKAKLPIEGLEITEDCIRLNGVPLSQASTAQQLSIAVAAKLAESPIIRVIGFPGGSLLDTETRAALYEMAAKANAQVVLEMVTDDDALGVVIHEGEEAPDVDAG